VDERAFRELISGRRRGLRAALGRLGLQLLTPFYGLAIWNRNTAFNLGLRAIHSAEIPVVSLGNLTTGGTGKTPLAAFVARWFRQHHVRVAFLSRGYRALAGEVNDEALVLDQLCPDVPHLQNPDRVESARIAHEELESQLVILDDGFQYRRLARDLDIALIDVLNPFGFGHLLPRGLLREPLSSLRRADLIVLTRVDQCSAEALREIRAQVARIGRQSACVEIAFRPQRLINAHGQTADWADFREQPVAAFCGIGNPAAFQQTLTEMGLPNPEFREFPDHHPYSRGDIEQLQSWSRALRPRAVLTTQKDLVKIGLSDLGGIPLWAVEIGVEILAGADLLESELKRVLDRIPPAADDT
jgi:tetraacyldisaccharide 4'-kinase